MEETASRQVHVRLLMEQLVGVCLMISLMNEVGAVSIYIFRFRWKMVMMTGQRGQSPESPPLPPPPPPERGFQPDHLQCSCFPVSLCSSSGIVHLTPYAWQLSEEDNPIDTTRNDGICSTFDTRFISSTYWAELTTQQRDRHQRGGWVGGGPTLWRLNLTSGLRPIMQQVSGQLPKWVWFFLLKTPHPSAEFLLLQSSPWLPEALLFTDTCSVTLIPPMTPIHI